MTPAATIDLDKPLVGPKAPIKELKFRDPVLGDIVAVGAEPVTEAMSKDGLYFRTVNWEAVLAYARRLVVEPSDPLLLNGLCVADSRKLEKAITGFFEDSPASESAPTNSSSLSGTTPGPSNA